MEGQSDRTSGPWTSALEIVQTRDLDQTEARLVAVASSKRVIGAARRDWRYWAGRILMIGGLVVWLISLSALLKAAGGDQPHGVYIFLAVLAFAAGGILMVQRQYGALATATAAQFRAGTRYALQDDGLYIAMTGIHGLFQWRGITALVPSGPFLYVHVGSAHLTALPLAAIADQDVKGFCREMERRWHATRVQAP